MQKRTISIILCLMLLSVLVLNVSAESNLPMVTDSAGLLSGEERIELEEKAQDLRAEYDMDVVILTVDSLGGKSAQDYADDYYDDNGYGYGENYSGILFLLAMEEREWYISTCGDAIYAVTDYGVEQLGETVVPFLSTGLYYEAFTTYLVLLQDYFDAYQDGRPIDGHADYSGDYYRGERDEVLYSDTGRTHASFPIALIIGLVAATVTILIMRASMNTKRPQRSAGVYLRSGSYHLRTHQDMFLYSRVHKVRRQQNNNSSGGGSSVHRSSGGRSHGGGGGRF